VSVFGATYAGAYDTLYGEKDYAAECDMIEALMALTGGAAKSRLIDLGCGTGNHAIPLAQRGFAVTGLDMSAAMLERARQKAAIAGVAGKTDFQLGDVRQALPGVRDFNAAIMMFAVLGYQQTDVDVRAALSAARGYLVPGAPFIFDVWYGPGVVADKPGPRERTVGEDGQRLVRRTNSILDEERHLCAVQFDLEVWRDGVRVEQTHEEHVMRFFFPEELERFAISAGFYLLTLRSFPEWQNPVSGKSWNAVGVLRAV
jgi:SAM-dependent methyltransferase